MPQHNELILNFKSYFTQFFIFILLWASLWAIIGEYALPPKGPIYVLSLLFISAVSIGKLSSLINGIPPLFGMLIAGFILRNTIQINLNPLISSFFRNFSLGIIMLRAGLGLDPLILKKLLIPCLRLALLPSLFETITIAIASNLLLQFSWSWSLLFGFVIASVSPAVVVPSMLTLQEMKLGTEKGIHTLVIASASIENVYVIAAFGVSLNVVFSDPSDSYLWFDIIKGFEAIGAGIAYGTIFGLLLWYFPSSKNNDNDSLHNIERFVILVLSGTFAMFGGAHLNLNGAGAVGCVTTAFIANIKWKKLQLNEQIKNHMKFLWLICEPFLFGLIGLELSLSYLSNGSNMSFLIISFVLGLFIRIIVTILILWGADLNLKEKMFVSIAWIPKATVQAAIGPMALDLARIRNDDGAISVATQILMIAVISIIVTAPIGAVAISLSAPKLLKCDTFKYEKIYEESNNENCNEKNDEKSNEIAINTKVNIHQQTYSSCSENSK